MTKPGEQKRIDFAVQLRFTSRSRGSGFVLVRNSVISTPDLAAATTNGRFRGCVAAWLSERLELRTFILQHSLQL